ncbi:glycosyltransferase [Vitiosangium sp. GDMCC 1.1324]|uniref:glycosyltransferase n=1 Tax=Vitiosangium sp. (strain GDMCC 1.1324) TaxID=2138576 RepID=UPI000D36927D|nr:nucleotide disphospho-sugar-binding domain-containing protein [Vitiosangium sp. GDMCC 1.1324]PTL83663.1 glycosyltransferase [Vitiosangium sp. GDMCC 1.1324]
MRVLFTTIPGSGHFHPLVPVAQALQQAGHEVAFASGELLQQQVQAKGFRFFRAGGEWPFAKEQDMGALAQRMESMMRMSHEARQEHLANNFVGHFAGAMVPHLVELASTWRPDLIVRDSMEFGAAIAGEHLGIPHASIQVGAALPHHYDSPLVIDRLNELRAKVGLPPDPKLQALYHYLHLCFVPAHYLGGELPRTAHFLQPAIFDQSGDERLPAWTSELGRDGRPVVYLTLGTVFNKVLGVMRTLVEGVREEPVDVVVTVGRDLDPAALGPQPAHVHVERYIPQTLLFPKVDLAILHGGYNSTTSALDQGLPLVLVPIAADQPMNAERCTELGVARVVSPLSLTRESIREAVRDVLRTPSYRENARRFQKEARALPGLPWAVELLEKLAAERQPQLRG